MFNILKKIQTFKIVFEAKYTLRITKFIQCFCTKNLVAMGFETVPRFFFNFKNASSEFHR